MCSASVTVSTCGAQQHEHLSLRWLYLVALGYYDAVHLISYASLTAFVISWKVRVGRQGYLPLPIRWSGKAEWALLMLLGLILCYAAGAPAEPDADGALIVLKLARWNVLYVAFLVELVSGLMHAGQSAWAHRSLRFASEFAARWYEVRHSWVM